MYAIIADACCFGQRQQRQKLAFTITITERIIRCITHTKLDCTLHSAVRSNIAGTIADVHTVLHHDSQKAKPTAHTAEHRIPVYPHKHSPLVQPIPTLCSDSFNEVFVKQEFVELRHTGLADTVRRLMCACQCLFSSSSVAEP